MKVASLEMQKELTNQKFLDLGAKESAPLFIMIKLDYPGSIGSTAPLQ